jgi:Cys-tRNA(Pro)/Cys-tRNA(Cys) deacylase
MLDKAGVAYEALSYPVDESDLSGVHVAALIGRPAEQVYKTLVLHGEKHGYFVCCVPSAREVNLKKAAAAAGEKKAEMIPVKDILPVTGYIRGGCSPIGMKKRLPTYIDASALALEQVIVSAGQRGAQLVMRPADLLAACGGVWADLV